MSGKQCQLGLRCGFVLGIMLFWFPVHAQVLAVQPVNIFLHAGEQATTLGVTNQAATDTAVQVRAYVWTQKDGVDSLTPTNDLMVSPPIATIPAHATQIIRLVQRSSPAKKEGTYRILVDQIPSAAAPGTIRIVLRLSIPIFAEPMVQANPHGLFHVEQSGDKLTLVGVNDGNRHDALHKIELKTADGILLQPMHGSSPYLLAGSTQRWQLEGAKIAAGTKALSLSADGINGKIHEQVSVVAAP